jgi:CRISPR system Cascade subunit CasB
MDPRAPAAPAFFRLLAGLPEHGPLDRRGWALLIHSLALAAPGLVGGRGEFGTALFEAGYSEGRLARLLQARAEDLADVVPRTVRFLAAHDQALNPAALAYFIRDVSRGGGAAERARERIARTYYRAEYAATQPSQQPAGETGSHP